MKQTQPRDSSSLCWFHDYRLLPLTSTSRVTPQLCCKDAQVGIRGLHFDPFRKSQPCATTNHSSLGPWLRIVLDDNWIGDLTGGGKASKVRREKTANARSGERVGLAANARAVTWRNPACESRPFRTSEAPRFPRRFPTT